jgi:sugar phosphate isomerase/epimerase
MNFPGRSVVKEIHRIAEDRFDFVDLTLEPPAAWFPDGKEVGRLLGDLGLTAVGHTPYYLPIASPFPELRKVARDLFRRALDCFADARVELVNVHPDQRVPLQSADRVRTANADAIAGLAEDAAARGIRLMVENLDNRFSRVEDFEEIFRTVPDAGFHLDVGHANLSGHGRLAELIEAYGDRLAHVHLSDNTGGSEDRHLPLGAGNIDWRTVVRWLKGAGYDGTVTLEVFSRTREHLRTSRKLWLGWWTDKD